VAVIIVEFAEGRSPEQKQRLIEKLTDDFCEIMEAKPETVAVLLHELPLAHAAKGGKTVLKKEPAGTR
jgi:4-oxalocrotonate tautomerase